MGIEEELIKSVKCYPDRYDVFKEDGKITKIYDKVTGETWVKETEGWFWEK